MSGMDRLTELLPCPFCGGDNVTVFGPVGWYRDYGISHSCTVFYNGTGDFTVGAKSKAQAIAAWNRRASQAAPAPSDGLRERAEAAERAHLSLCEAIGIPATALSHIEYTAQLTAARRAEAAAWNDAIEAADKAAIDRQGRRAMGDGHGNSCYDIGVSDAAAAIRALRRAAPTEGEAQSLDDTTRAVLDRAERIVAGQSQQEQRTAEIFLRPTEGEA